ncbi:MAG: hypothetical protein P0Y49_15440 [Candidatus Pedobacter colombiensis]|uniref:Phage tail tape measure protein n=1 Tax=Candidatus Pedobacter colombiensis TaxID=3121371 RepID=A0AAJ6B5V2_9SPHI|nr:hypothetical protein [Pedobacter sp.]WEK18184.1 MAG: hypothetical protein P0Y49_15440 [Pedobacter sp.]
MAGLDITLSLNDEKFKAGIKSAQIELKNIKESFSLLKSIGFELPELDNMVATGIKAFDTYKVANTQLQNSLKATHNSAGLSIDALVGQAQKLQHTTLFSSAQTQEAQALLLGFSNIKEKVMMEAMPAIQDLATAISGGGEGDLNGATKLVGEALHNPIKGIQALKAAGVNFNQTQEDTIANLVATGKTADAQGIILGVLSENFGGSAVAAREAKGEFGDYQETMSGLYLAIGGVADKLREGLAPGFSIVAGLVSKLIAPLKNVVDWMGKNKTIVQGLAIGLAIGAAGFFTLNGLVAFNTWLMGASSAAFIINTLVTEGLSAAWLALNMVMAANPIGAIIVAIALLSAGIYMAYQKSATFRAVLAGIGEIASSLVPIFIGLGKVILGAMTFNPSLIAQGFKQSVDGIKKITEGGGISGIFKKAFNKSLEDSAKKERDEQTKKKENELKRPSQKGNGSQLNAPAHSFAGGRANPLGRSQATNAPAARNESVGGSRSVRNISVTIQKMVGIENMNTTNIKEGFSDAGNLIREALIKSIRDSEIAVSGE